MFPSSDMLSERIKVASYFLDNSVNFANSSSLDTSESLIKNVLRYYSFQYYQNTCLALIFV